MAYSMAYFFIDIHSRFYLIYFVRFIDYLKNEGKTFDKVFFQGRQPGLS